MSIISDKNKSCTGRWVVSFCCIQVAPLEMLNRQGKVHQASVEDADVGRLIFQLGCCLRTLVDIHYSCNFLCILCIKQIKPKHHVITAREKSCMLSKKKHWTARVRARGEAKVCSVVSFEERWRQRGDLAAVPCGRKSSLIVCRTEAYECQTDTIDPQRYILTCMPAGCACHDCNFVMVKKVRSHENLVKMKARKVTGKFWSNQMTLADLDLSNFLKVWMVAYVPSIRQYLTLTS